MAWAASILILLPLLWAGYRVYIYRKALRYSPSESSKYALPEGLPLMLGEFRDLPSEEGVLLLEVDLASSLLGWLFDPSLTVGGQEFCLERGIQGKRHLVLPLPLPGTAVHLKHVRAKPSARAWVYQARGFEKLAIIAPHPDDAEIAAFATYRAHSAHILNVTQGEKGLGPNPDVVGKMRTFDARTVPLLGGIPPENIRDLGWKESEFPLKADRLKELAAAILEFLKTTGAKQVVCPHPVMDGHQVHLDVIGATLKALVELNDPEVELLGALIHVPAARTYPIGPMNSPIALPVRQERQKAFDRLEAHWLSPDDQQLKIYALDANHDLRSVPLPYAEETGALAYARRRLRQKLTGTAKVASTDYYRRAVRACELFCVYSLPSIQMLWDEASARE